MMRETFWVDRGERRVLGASQPCTRAKGAAEAGLGGSGGGRLLPAAVLLALRELCEIRSGQL